MSRPIRIQYSGAVYHVMNRGNARQRIFKTSEHYQLFLRCLAEVVQLWHCTLHAFSLMPNHYHLLIETPSGNLSRVMRHLNHVYTQRFNRMTGRDGHLFRGRYKSILVEDDAYLVELIRYIHLNPVKAALTKRPEQHAWTSHHYYMGRSAPDFLTTDRILGYFGRRKNLARRKLHEFVVQGVPAALERQLSGQRLPSVLSSENFEKWIQWNFVKDLEDDEVTYVPVCPPKISEGVLRAAVCRYVESDWSSLKNPKGRREQQKRAQAIWLYRYYLKAGYGALSKVFGVAPSRISRIMQKEGLVSQDLREQISLAVERGAQK
jgi:REP element-mobilizing transposase RayT